MKRTFLLLSLALASMAFTLNAQDDWNDNPATPAVKQTQAVAPADDWNDNPATPATADQWNDNTEPAQAAPTDDWNDNPEPAKAAPAEDVPDTPAPATTKKSGSGGGFGIWWLLILIVPVAWFFLRKKKKTNKEAAPAEEPKAEEPKEEPAEEPAEEPKAEEPAAQPVAPAAADTQYFVSVKGKEYGPYTAGQMQDFIAQGRMNKRTKMRTADATEFATAASFAFLDWDALPAKSSPKAEEKLVLTTGDQVKVSVKGKEYGPYTPEQMAAFIAEGRMNKNTKVMIVGKTDWIKASDVSDFADKL